MEATVKASYDKYIEDDKYVFGIIINDERHCNAFVTYTDVMAEYLKIPLEQFKKILSKHGFKKCGSSYTFDTFDKYKKMKITIEGLFFMGQFIEKINKK